MIYPNNFEEKIGFTALRDKLKSKCLSQLGRENVEQMTFSTDAAWINEEMARMKEMRLMIETEESFEINFISDLRPSLHRVKIEGTHLEEAELFELKRNLQTITTLIAIFQRHSTDAQEVRHWTYPHLQQLVMPTVPFNNIIRDIEGLIDKYGRIKDTASPNLSRIRKDLLITQSGVSKTLNNILRSAQTEGLIDKDAKPSLRDGRLVIPIAPAMRRKLKGIVHDESSSGKTVFIEPTAVVEANNKIRELEIEERKEIIKILVTFTQTLRPYLDELIEAFVLLGVIDFLQAKYQFSLLFNAIEVSVDNKPILDWSRAFHPLLYLSLQKHNKPIVPLDILLDKNNRLLIISGPNAGGKSVCLKTVGIIQYMLQCGVPVPLSLNSRVGVFNDLMIDIGDEQSLEDDLSTYSSHLQNMKQMIRSSHAHSLILIDEFGTGTEPQIGAAIAEAILKQFCENKTFGIITTHYQNLKHFADEHEGVINGAMLYDRHEMKALYQLQIGRPGSSFAIEIARKIGLPEVVIQDASQIVGSEYIMSDKYLQDIVRDKRYWEQKRQNIHRQEKEMNATMTRYEVELEKIAKEKKNILKQAKEQAEQILKEGNKRVENLIRDIREKQAEKESTKKLRAEFDAYRQTIQQSDEDEAFILKKMEQIKARKERKKQRKNDKTTSVSTTNQTSSQPVVTPTKITVGNHVRMKGLTSVGQVTDIKNKTATVVFAGVQSKISLDKLEVVEAPKKQINEYATSRQTRQTIDTKKDNFKQDLDVRGMRGEEALQAVTYFIDDAILVSMPRVRILHGTGNGILRQLIRQYLSTVSAVVHYQDEDVRYGGSGITVVDL